MSIVITMPYYYVIIRYVSKITGSLEVVSSHDMTEDILRRLVVEPFSNGVQFVFMGKVVDPDSVEEIHIFETSKKVKEILLAQRRTPQEHNVGQPSDSVKDVLRRIREGKIGGYVTHKFMTSLSKVSNKKRPSKKLSRNVFIVHGRDHTPLKELKVMLKGLGLNPIVLHEKASGGLTLAEKLEKYSKDVGYAFVVLTPDDTGCFREDFLNVYKVCLSEEGESEEKRKEKAEFFFHEIPKKLTGRARQNVIFEMGYFWGLLERKKVCCLLKGKVEKPSDIHGIVYESFKKSINEVRDRIIKELKEAGYKIKM